MNKNKKTDIILSAIGLILIYILVTTQIELHSGSLILGYALGIYCTLGITIRVKQERSNTKKEVNNE